jgi:hypothetical protein
MSVGWCAVVLVLTTPAAETSLVMLDAPARSRLASELRRELATSGFTVVERGAAPWTVSVSEEDRVKVVSREGTALNLWVDPSDRLARRRACLAVVELLRLEAAKPAPPPAAPIVLVDSPPPPHGHSWALGAATTVNVDSVVRQPTGNLQLLGQVALGPRLSVSIRGLWPLLGSDVTTPDLHVRMWTFGAAAGVKYSAGGSAKLRPYVGATAGGRWLLADTSWREARQSRVVLTPSAVLAAQIGACYPVATLAQLFLELEAAQDWRLAGARATFEDDAANAYSFHASVGVLFDY